MANIPRLPRPGDDWNQNDLRSYDIRLEFQDTQTFFGDTNLPESSIQQDFLTALCAKDTANDESYNLLVQAACAKSLDPSEPSNVVVDFTVSLLHSVGYIRRPRYIQTRVAQPFYCCHEEEEETIHNDVCVIDNTTGRTVLIVQEAQSQPSRADPHARLVIAAIAAFQMHNWIRSSMVLPKLDSMVIPGIIMLFSTPSFFKIPVTRDLAECVRNGQFPSAPTIVAGHVPKIPIPIGRFTEGMVNLDNRRIFLQCFEAFKKFLV
ncbi:hypothetical protein BDN70DRAFT_958995 [Pholiota conissans]|uniref:Uncharacterized protein n=1 Tax=Pholiota conissans TaxID=109636 RepID=A0A9P5ZBA5_9AGAR|nr:hypothetical protein BDN70DRAFT_958995 [Pholiota conissans]